MLSRINKKKKKVGGGEKKTIPILMMVKLRTFRTKRKFFLRVLKREIIRKEKEPTFLWRPHCWVPECLRPFSAPSLLPV